MQRQTRIHWSPPSTQQWLKQPVRSLANIVRRKKPGSLQKFLIYAIGGEHWERNDLNLMGLRNTGKWTTTSRGAWKRQQKNKQTKNWIGEQKLKKIWGRTTVRGHSNWWKTWPLWNKEKLPLSKIVKENVSQKNERYWTDGQNTVLSSITIKPMEIHQYWTVPRQTQRMTTQSVARKWRLQYNHWRKGSRLESTTAQQNWSKQVERM